MGKTLVTGGFGLIGYYLVKSLLDEGKDIVVFQRRKIPPYGREDILDKVKVVSGDVRNWVNVIDVIKNNDIDCIYHSAAWLVGDCEYSPLGGYQVNVNGTLNILEASRILNVKSVIYISSGFVLNMMKDNLFPPRSQSDQMHPINLYGVSKISCELLGQYYFKHHGVNFRAVRFPMVIGPGREISYYFGDYSGAIELPAKNKKYIIHVNANNNVPLIYVKDCAQALIALNAADEIRLKQRNYNIYGFKTTMQKLADTVKKYLPNAEISFEYDNSPEMELACNIVSYEMDNTPAKEDFDWESKYSLEKTVEDFIREIKARN